MFKLTDAGDLEKAGRSLGSFFSAQADTVQKTFDFHKAVAIHHDGLQAKHDALHKGHAARHTADQAHADGLDAGDVHKAHILATAAHHMNASALHKAASDHHDAIAKAHHAHADALKTQIDALKALGGNFGSTVKAEGGGKQVDVKELAKGSGSLDERVQQLSEALMTKAFEALNNDATIGEKIQEIVLGQVEKAVGGKLVPTDVRKFAPDVPGGITAIPRAGGAPLQKPNVPMQFEKMFAVEDGE